MTSTGETIPPGATPRTAEIEINSIQPIPDSERHGTIGQQWRLWYACNANFFCVVLGSFAVLLGLNLFWAIVGIVIGSVIGGVLTGLHAVQGPRLGVPQMIQSRGQFGFYFGVVLFLMGILLDVGYMGGGVVVGAHGTIAERDKASFELRSKAQLKKSAAGSERPSGESQGELLVRIPAERFDPEGF